jgi:hypothetical protein
VLSAIKSPVFSKVVVVYQEGDSYRVVHSGYSRSAIKGEAAWYHRQFDVFHEMYKARDFELVLKASGLSADSVQELGQAVAAETMRGGLPPDLSVIYP